MSWIQISVKTHQNTTHRVEDVLLSLGAASVTLKDAENQPILEPAPGETPLWDHAIVTGMFDSDNDAGHLTDALRQALGTECCDLSIENLEDQDWGRAWMDHYDAMRFGERLWVCPWHRDPPDPAAINLRLDPGLAFGTGTHPTTALCLRWLDANVHRQLHLLDYGCGSGILAIAALLLGVETADGVDIDDQALYASRENARANHVDERLALLLPPAFNRRPAEKNSYDIVVANILSGPLVDLAPILAGYVRPGGDIVLSGILSEQAKSVYDRYSAYFSMDGPVFDDGWVMLHGCRFG